MNYLIMYNIIKIIALVYKDNEVKSIEILEHREPLLNSTHTKETCLNSKENNNLSFIVISLP